MPDVRQVDEESAFAGLTSRFTRKSHSTLGGPQERQARNGPRAQKEDRRTQSRPSEALPIRASPARQALLCNRHVYEEARESLGGPERSEGRDEALTLTGHVRAVRPPTIQAPRLCR